MSFVQRAAPGAGRLAAWKIPEGDAGVYRTVAHMRALARERSTLLAEAAASIVWATGGEPGATARGIRDFVAEVIRYVPDAWGAEVVRSPAYLLRRIRETGFAYGDCDDMATLAAALGLAVGLPARYVLVGFRGGPWEHVFTEIWTPGGWLEIDPSKPEGLTPSPGDRHERINL